MAPSNNDDGLNTGSDTVNDSYAGTIQEEIVHPLLAGDESSADTTHSAAIVGRPILRRLYASHFLSTFNSRVFEFGAVLFLAAVYPASLAPLSTYALVRNAAAIVLSRVVGAWIDAGDRLAVVRTSIVAGRAAVVASCAALLGLLSLVRGNEASPTGWGSTLLFVVLVGLACVEKLTSIMNLMAVERDWVVAMTEDDDLLRQNVNAKMRRIDLFCKLVGPLAIALLDGISTRIAIWATLSVNVMSVGVEYWCIAKVYTSVPTLRRLEMPPESVSQDETGFWRCLASNIHQMLPFSSFTFYFRHAALLPSFSLALLYFTVLSFSGQMVTFLLAVGLTSVHVGVIRAASTIFELSATWVGPRLMSYMGTVRAGIWSLSWQMICLGVGVIWSFAGERLSFGGMGSVAGLVGGVILSRLGLWSFDLCAQSIVQEDVEESHRGRFSSVEATFQNLFELLSYGTTIVFSRPDQFRWPMLMSIAAVYLAGLLYAVFVRRRRGHLFHAPPCLGEKA